MLGETHQLNPSTVHVPSWTLTDDPTAGMFFPHPVSPVSPTGGITDYSPFLTALQRYLPSNIDAESDVSDMLTDTYSSDEFRMYDFKVRRCSRGRSHDWTECPYAHPGEKARRRDPLRYNYTGTACPDFRKGNCRRGDACEFAHGVFECWLHPARYRTQPCKDGTACRRRVCFFAHTPKQLRIATHQVIPRSPDLYDGSPLRHALDHYMSPTTTLSPPSDSPPMSPSNVNEVIGSMRRLRLSGAGSWGAVGSPGGSNRRPSGVASPTWNSCIVTDFVDEKEQPIMERVESGKELRSKIFEKLSKENSVSVSVSVSADPDVDWVSELIQ